MSCLISGKAGPWRYFTAVKDLLKLYNAYFEPQFSPFSGLNGQAVLKKIVITIEGNFSFGCTHLTP
jgi:hypothetical protein